MMRLLCMAIILSMGCTAMADDGVNVWVADALLKVLPNAAIPENAPKGVEINAVRNEYESGQVVVTTANKIEKLTASVGTFIGPDGQKPRGNVQFEGLVKIKKNTLRTQPEDLVAMAPAEIPDPLLEKRSVCVDAGKNQPIWLTVYVPKTTKPGKYTSTVEITADGVSRSVPISVQVHNFTLPDDRTLIVTNWLAYGNVAGSHKAGMWSEQFWKLLETYACFMADYRQNMIITPTLGLITGQDDGKGKLTFDFSLFDKWVEVFKRAGIEYIEGGHLGGRKDWALPDIYGSWPVILGLDGKPLTKPETNAASEEYREFLSQFFPALQKHLEKKGWINSYMQHVNDEPTTDSAKSYRQLASLVHKYAPKIKIMDALGCNELVGSADIWIPHPEHFEKEIPFFRERQKAGDQVWFYTCLNPKGKYMNRFIDFHLIDVRLLHWVNFKYDLTGYLHWGLNYYDADPFGNVELVPGGTTKPFPPGDSHIIYPGLRGPLSSIRFEAMRDGIEDYELLKLLEKKNSKLAREIADSVVRSLTDYTTNPAEFRQARQRIVKGLEE